MHRFFWLRQQARGRRVVGICLLVLAVLLYGGKSNPMAAQGPGGRPDVQRWLQAPRATQVEAMLQAQGQLDAAATKKMRQEAVSAWYRQFHKTHAFGSDPAAWARLQARERALLAGDVEAAGGAFNPLPTNILGLVVTFDGPETVERLYPDPVSGGCQQSSFTYQSLALNQDPAPGPRDNFSFYKDGIRPADYQAVIFGTGEDAPGYGVVRPDLGGVDLRGLTLNNYLLEMSQGAYAVGGAVLPQPVTMPHPQEVYGQAVYQADAQGRCQADPASDAGFMAFAQDAVAAMLTAYPQTGWQQFDANGDHVIDLFFIIHAGYGWQDGGGEDRLSDGRSSFSLNGLPRPQVAGQQTPDDPSDDYFIDNFAVFSEQTPLGVFLQTFEYFLGLPDLATLDGMNSNGFWGAQAAGVWAGSLAGTRPAGHNLWQDWLLGWKHPQIINYDDPAHDYVLGRLRQTPPGTTDGLIIRLPDKEVEVSNRAGSGGGWWSGSENDIDHRIWRQFDLGGAVAPVYFSFDAVWNLEDGWDYGYVELSPDGGASWQTLPDTEGILTRADPHGLNQGWGLTGRGEGRLRFDLSAFSGQTVVLRLRYISDRFATEPGWWVDNLSLDDANGNLYSNELESPSSDWVNEGWLTVPFVQRSQHYYLAEWRAANGFDQALNDPYQIVYQDKSNHETKVNRLPATTPALIISYRDLSQPFDAEMLSDLAAAPSYGPKYGLLVVDAHPWPQRFDSTTPAFQDAWVGVPLSGRAVPGDAGFGLQETRAWTARLGWDFETGSWSSTPLETKTWPALPPVPAFHDALNYTPGFFYPGSGSLLYLHDWDASAVLPAAAPYSTPISWPDGRLYPDLYGVEVAPGRLLGTGNPGDEGAQYGLHIQVLAQSEEQATVRVWQAMHEVAGSGQVDAASAATGDIITISFAAQNVGSAGDFFAFAPLPAGTRYVEGSGAGDFFVVGLPAAQVRQAWLQGDLGAQMRNQGAGDVSGFAFLGQLATGESMIGSFKVEILPSSGPHSVDADLIFYTKQQAEPFRVLSASVPVINTAPVLQLIGNQLVNEGSPWQLDVAFIDPDADTWSATVDYGEGAGPQPLAILPGQRLALAHTYQQDGDYLVSLQVHDGYETASAQFVVSVLNVPPNLTLPPAPRLQEGGRLALTGRVEDAGADALSVSVQYGDGSAPQTPVLAADGSFQMNHVYADNGVYTITVQASDGTALSTGQVPVTVDNVPPVIEEFTLADGPTGSTAQANVVFNDPGADRWSATLDFGDGTPPLHLDDVLSPFQAGHVYAAGGVYTATLLLEDDDGGQATATRQVQVWQTVALPLLADTWVDAGAPQRNYAAYGALIVRPTGVDHAFLSFDRALLPAGAAVLDAQ